MIFVSPNPGMIW